MSKPLITITGATSGIGLELAKLLNKKGYPLLLIGRQIEKLAVLNLNNVLIRSVDVTNLEQFRFALSEAEEVFGHCDCLINNAGVMLLGELDRQDSKEWHVMLNTNVLGVMNGMQAVLNGMKKRQHGTIINVSSIAGIKPFPNHAAYTATKFAVHGLTDNVREEVAMDNIRVITIAPGAVETPLLSHTTNEQIKNDYQAWKEEVGGVLQPKVVAETIAYAYEQPQSVCIREIVLSATRQQA